MMYMVLSEADHKRGLELGKAYGGLGSGYVFGDAEFAVAFAKGKARESGGRYHVFKLVQTHDVACNIPQPTYEVLEHAGD